MERQADVRAIMARFNTGVSKEGVHGGHPSVAGHATSAPGSSLQARKAALEGRMSGTTSSSTPSPKPSFPKSAISARDAQGASSEPEFPKPKALAGRIQSLQEDRKPPLAKQSPFQPKPLVSSQDDGPKPAFPKVPLKKPSVSNMASDSKLTFPKLPPTLAKPSVVTDSPKLEDTGGDGVPAAPKMPPFPKQKSSIMALQSQLNKGGTEDSGGVKPHPVLGQKSSSGEDGTEEHVKPPSSSNSGPPHSPLSMKPSFPAQKPGLAKKPLGSVSQDDSSDPSAPKKKPLPSPFAIGSPPPKPARPPNVNLEKFRNATDSTNDDPGTKAGPLPPPPPPTASHPANSAAPPLPSHPSAAPNLPPRPPGPAAQPEDESYDDVGVMNSPPPLPSGGHPSQKAEESGSDGEMYEDLDERWATKEKEKTKKKDKEEKKRLEEEKKRLEQQKKEQKEREKKEQEVRKKFKLTGPIQVIHQVKARVDCKGGKNDLTASQGDLIEIVRTTDNPGGRWLGRTQDGSYGYVKIDSVEIDYDDLKQQKAGLLPGKVDENPELYDDVGISDNISSAPKGKVPPPSDGDIYDDVDSSGASLPPPPPPPAGPNDDIYDDVESQAFPPPPPIISLPQMKPKGKTEDRDPKKQKKFEKEEKEFRKKFKFEGEIQVLYQVTIASTLTTKKWGSKDLPLKPGEKIDVIVQPVDNKLIGRNQDGKFGYVSTSNIVADDTEIYDDVGEDCIYDND